MTDSPKPAVPQYATVTIKGRPITVKRPTDAQAVIMHRYGKVGQAALTRLELAEATPDIDDAVMDPLRLQGMDSVSEMLDMIERLVTDLDDRAFLVEQMKDGNLELADLAPITEAFMEKKKRAPKAARVK